MIKGGVPMTVDDMVLALKLVCALHERGLVNDATYQAILKKYLPTPSDRTAA